MINTDLRNLLILTGDDEKDEKQVEKKIHEKSKESEDEKESKQSLLVAQKQEDTTSEATEENEVIIIKQEPPRFIETFESQQVEQGSSCCLNVRIDQVVDDVKWMCGDDIITSSRYSHMTVVSDNDFHSLIINDIRLLDTSQYTCVVSNSVGECRCSADILVLRKQIISFKVVLRETLLCHQCYQICLCC